MYDLSSLGKVFHISSSYYSSRYLRWCWSGVAEGQSFKIIANGLGAGFTEMPKDFLKPSPHHGIFSVQSHFYFSRTSSDRDFLLFLNE